MLPKQLHYQSKIESAPSRSQRLNVAPQNGTGPYNIGDTIIINIPTRANLVLAPSESYLKFNLVSLYAVAATAIRFDSCGAHSLIQRIRVWHGSNLLQDIDNYALLAKMMFDLQVPTDACYGKFNVMAGTRNDLTVIMPVGGPNAGDIYGAYQSNSGELIRNAAGGTTLAAGGTTMVYTFCLNLLSLVGTFQFFNSAAVIQPYFSSN